MVLESTSNSAESPEGNDPGVQLFREVQLYLESLERRETPTPAMEQSWREFYDVYDLILRSLARWCGLQASDLDDCVQQTWQEVITHLADFRHDPDDNHFRGWLHKVFGSKISNL